LKGGLGGQPDLSVTRQNETTNACRRDALPILWYTTSLPVLASGQAAAGQTRMAVVPVRLIPERPLGPARASPQASWVPRPLLARRPCYLSLIVHQRKATSHSVLFSSSAEYCNYKQQGDKATTKQSRRTRRSRNHPQKERGCSRVKRRSSALPSTARGHSRPSSRQRWRHRESVAVE
jgi:hypothetical protein